jgi:hypothetical protein
MNNSRKRTSRVVFSQTSINQNIRLALPIARAESMRFELVNVIGTFNCTGSTIWLSCTEEGRCGLRYTTMFDQVDQPVWIQPNPIPLRSEQMPLITQVIASSNDDPIVSLPVRLRSDAAITLNPGCTFIWCVTFEQCLPDNVAANMDWVNS